MQPDLHSRALAAHTLHQFRTLSPLTHCMTNEVVQSFTANTLLALGASPAMVIEGPASCQSAFSLQGPMAGMDASIAPDSGLMIFTALLKG